MRLYPYNITLLLDHIIISYTIYISRDNVIQQKLMQVKSYKKKKNQNNSQRTLKKKNNTIILFILKFFTFSFSFFSI